MTEPSTKAAAWASETWWGSSQHRERAPSSRARPSEPAAAVGVGQRELPERGPRLAALQQRGELAAGQVVGDALAVEDPDRDRVGARPRGRLGDGADVHVEGRILESPQCPTP